MYACVHAVPRVAVCMQVRSLQLLQLLDAA
jgi:hypothetical protein